MAGRLTLVHGPSPHAVHRSGRYGSSVSPHAGPALPADLPVPVDDGACDHLRGRLLPDVELPASSGEAVSLGRLLGSMVVVVHPAMGRPDQEPSGGLQAWNAIPGARGCTPQACGYRDHHAELMALGIRLVGLSTQPAHEQREAAARLGLPFELLSDSELALSRRLRLPTFESGGRLFLRRATLIVLDGRIERVFYPVFPPDRDAERVLDWLTSGQHW